MKPLFARLWRPFKEDKLKLAYLMPLFAAVLLIGRFLVTDSLLNRLEAIPTTYLSSNTTGAAAAAGTLISALNSNGFTLGSSALVNNSGDSYVAWNWKCGSTSGCDIKTWTGNGANRTIAHSLGATPAFIMVKRTDTTGNWAVYHQSLGNTQYMFLNSLAAAASSATYWNNTSPNTSNFTVGTGADVNANGGSYQAYIFAEKPGFSKFGSYTGNGSSDGTFIYTGFKPRWVLVRAVNSAEHWFLWDTARDTANPAVADLYPNLTSAEATSLVRLDMLANGFKLRASTANPNLSGVTYLYAAFAEYPFEYASTNGNGLSLSTSTRFNGTNAYLSRTFGSTGDRQKFTWSGWVKRSKLTGGNYYPLYWAGNDVNTYSVIHFSSTADDSKLVVINDIGTTDVSRVSTVGVFRDPSKWYHVVVAIDSTQATAANRVKIYVDGAQQSTTLEVSPPLNQLWSFNANVNSEIGYESPVFTTYGQTRRFDGYLSDVYAIDGQQLDPTVFASTDSNGRWSPKSYVGTYVSATGAYISSVLSNGFQLGTKAIVNTLNDAYVAWTWKESATSGFDIVTYTGTGANRTVAHTLGATPAFMLIKRTDSAANWTVWHQSLIPTTTGYLVLNSTAAQSTSATMWNSTAPTFALISLGTDATVNANGGTYTAYLWSEKPGFSKFGTYTGNGSADGPFVYTGFKPKYVLIKRTDSTTTALWNVVDGGRSSAGNPSSLRLYPGSTAAEETNTYMDLLANGFKLRVSNVEPAQNETGATYIYAAFAEYPFEYASTNSGLTVASSTRFNGTNAYLSRTPATAGNRQKWTWSGWVKRAAVSTAAGQALFANGALAQGNDYSYLAFSGTTDRLVLQLGIGGTQKVNLQTNALFRDPSVWNHIVVSVDTTQATQSDRAKVYVNGSQVTSFSTNTNSLALNDNTSVNNNVLHTIGANSISLDSYLSGYQSATYFIDGQALTPTSFAQADTNGRWSPKAYVGTYGTNGFRLQFGNATSPGADTSGQGNNFTANNIAANDNVADTPTNNFATQNSAANGTGRATLSNGNLQATSPAASIQGSNSTYSVSSGKWYWEFTSVTAGSGNADYPMATICRGIPNSLTDRCGGDSPGVIYSGIGTVGFQVDAGGAIGGVANFTTGDVIGFALDLDTNQINAYKNGVLQTTQPIPAGMYTPATSEYNGSVSRLNFGQGGQSGLTYDASSGGYFKYTPPSGFKALSSANMISAGTTNASLVKSNNWFDAVTYTGTGASSSITSLAFQPDLIWIKDRTSALSHVISDAVSGITCYLSSDSTAGKTCGTSNSFHLPLAGTSTIASVGTDTSGQGNFFTNNNIAATDAVIDTPTNNFPAMNPLVNDTSFGNATLSSGNLNSTGGASSGVSYSNVPISQNGKIYFEVNGVSIDNSSPNGTHRGIATFDPTNNIIGNSLDVIDNYVPTHCYAAYLNGANTFCNAIATSVSGDVFMVAYDGSTGNAWIGRNGTWFTGNPGTGSSPTKTFATTDVLYAFLAARGTSNIQTVNFGQGGQSSLTYDSASGGYFKYTPPSGFKALSSANMIAAGTTNASLVKSNNWFAAITYTGNGTTQAISTLNFQPDFIWIKDRTSAQNHVLYGDGSTIVNSVVQTFFQWFEY